MLKCRGWFGGQRQASSGRSGLHLTQKPTTSRGKFDQNPLETLRSGKKQIHAGTRQQKGTTRATKEQITRLRQLMKEHPSKSSGPPHVTTEKFPDCSNRPRNTHQNQLNLPT